MKNNKLNQIILVLVTVVVLFFILKDNFSSTIKIIGNMNLLLFAVSAFMYTIVFTLEAIISMKLVKEYKYDYTFKDAFKLSVITRFFNGVTPFSAGGRPLQVFELKKHGLRVLEGTNVIVQNFVIFQTSLTIYSVITLILNSIFKFFTPDSFLFNMTILGFIVNVVILLFALFLSISKNVNKKIVKFIINVGTKLKLIKNREKQYEKWEKTCNEYYDAFNDFKHKKSLIFSTIAIQLVALTFFYSVAYTVFLSLGYNPGSLIGVIVGSNFVFLTGSYIPIPGGSGGIEYAFLSYFGTFLTKGLLSPVLIIWRFITYYLPTLIGGIVFNIRKRVNK